MAPWHVTTFQKFEAQIPNRLEASIAFGLFMESVKQWATREGDPPDGKYRKYQDALTDYEIGRYAQEARNFLNTFGSDAVASKRAEFLQESLERYESAASRGHSRFRGLGIVEVMVTAFAWTIFLIAISFVLKYNGIDLFEIYQKVPGH